MGRKPKSRLSNINLIRPVFTTVVLSAFVLGISFFVKTLATSDTRSLMRVLRPVLTLLKIDEDSAGVVAGEFVSRLSQTGVYDYDQGGTSTTKTGQTEAADNLSAKQISFKVALLAGSHQNYANLSKALAKAKAQNVLHAFFLGDFTDYGEIENLNKAETIMEVSGIDYSALPGDHDLYDSVGPQNFTQVFGRTHFTKVLNGVKFVGLDNSANFTPIPDDIIAWFTAELKDADFVLLSQPLYHPSFNVVMGVVNGEVNEVVRAQALKLLELIQNTNAYAIIAADQHTSSQNADPYKTDLSHIVVGALTGERNFQSPRLAVLTVYTDGSYRVEDVLLQ